jgi:hypothetical protein
MERLLMPRFYFNVRDGDSIIIDPEGIEVPGLRAAEDEARQAARDILADRVKHGGQIDSKDFEVIDETGRQVLTLPFRSVLNLD